MDEPDITIVLADDHQVVRSGLRLLLQGEEGMHVVGEVGDADAEIAEELLLSVRTVESHRAHIQQKLSRTTRAELVRYALDQGFIDH